MMEFDNGLPTPVANDIEVVGDQQGRAVLSFGHWRRPCAIGRAGIVLRKREGDGATPSGRFALRRVLYRPDRVRRPICKLPAAPITPSDGWCDDPSSPAYNRQVRLPFDGSAEALWRDDGLYNLIVIVGHNDSPPRPGRGSAIFIHVAQPRLLPTEGCVALVQVDLIALLARLGRSTKIRVRAP